MNGPSHESEPEYTAATVCEDTPDPVPLSVALQIGVGSVDVPEGKNMVNVSVEPTIVPVNVPVLFR